MQSEQKPTAAKAYVLKGSSAPQSIELRMSLLSTLYDKAAAKSNLITEVRQRNLNYALVIFAGILGISAKVASDGHSPIPLSVVLVMLLALFSLFDRRLHRFDHGWRRTKTMFMEKMNDLVNDPEADNCMAAPA